MSKKANPEGMKWPTNKKQYDINYLKIFGRKCFLCGGTGGGAVVGWIRCCPKCKGSGYIEKNK